MATKEQREILINSIANDALLMIPTKDILKKYNISEATFYRIRKSKHFNDLVENKRMEAWEHTIQQCYTLAEIGYTEMVKILKSKSASDADKIRIWNIAVNNQASHAAQVSVLSRLANLEELTKADQGEYADE